jgi:putative transposase
VRTVRRECLDHVLIYGRRHLERALQEYIAHYVEERPHGGTRLGRTRREPNAASAGDYPNAGRRDVLGGLIHEYRWAA